MKFTSAFSLLAYAIKYGTAQAQAAEEGTCGTCLPLPPASKSFQTLRIYNITDPNWTAEQAIEESAKTTGPQLAKMSGFQRYTAATTGDSGLVLYMNQFASKEQAQAAHDDMVNNVGKWSNANNDKLEVFASAVTEGYAAFPQDSCFTESQVGKTLTSGLYKYQDPASVDINEQYTLEQDWYNELYSQIPGFIMSYVSTNAPAGDDKSVWKILESAADEEAYQALKTEKGYEWTGPANDKVITTIGTIKLDVLCTDSTTDDAADVSPPAPAPADDSTTADANPGGTTVSTQAPAPIPSSGSFASISASIVAVVAAVVML